MALSPRIRRIDRNLFAPDAAVLRLDIYTYDEQQNVYTAMVEECLYSREDNTKKMILLSVPDGTPPLAYPAAYLAVGEYANFDWGFISFQALSCSFHKDGQTVTLPPLLTVEAPEAETIPFRQYAESLQTQNNGCRVTRTSALEDLYPLHQQILTLTEGRCFTQSEYDQSVKVCVVSEQISMLLDAKVGDRIPFTLFRTEGDLYDPDNLRQVEAGDYEIVGVVSNDTNYSFCVFIPASASEGTIQPVTGYTLGQFWLKNTEVPAFQAQFAPLSAKGFRLNIYDQGYAAAMEPMEELLFISGIFLAACLLLAFCSLALQGYLFISRQRETAGTMLALGSGRLHVCVYFLTGTLALVITGIALGFLISTQIEEQVFELLKGFAAQFAEQDLRFSSTRLAIMRTLDFHPASSTTSYLTAAVLLTGSSLLFTLFVFSVSLRKKKTKKRNLFKQRVPKKAAAISRLSGFFKYALLSLRRGVVRTAAVLMLGAAAALFFSQLTASLTGYQNQLAAYKANAAISGSATDFYGKQTSGLVVNGRPIANLTFSGLVTDCCFTRNLGHIKFLGVEGGEQLPFYWAPYDSFAYESTLFMLSRESAWVGTSSIANGPLFQGADSGIVEWLEGWSEADFIRLEEKTYYPEPEIDYQVPYWTGPAICALSKSMMEANGIRLGDKINTAAAYGHPTLNSVMAPVQLLVVASYVSPKDNSAVYSPLTFVREGLEYQEPFVSPDDSLRVRPFQTAGLSENLYYSSFTFTLTDSTRLDELRGALDQAGFTWVHSGNRARSCAVIEDKIFLDTVHSMERQIQYVRVLHNALYLLAGIIGFALAWLLLQSRRQEIAIMRALGTQPGRIVGNFLAEQFLLMTGGLEIGVAAGCLAGTPICQAQLLLTAAFLGIWTLTTLICLIGGLRKKAFAALTEPE